MCKARKKGGHIEMIPNFVTLSRDANLHPSSCQQFLYYLQCLHNSSNRLGLNVFYTF
jgi:hypothetical protein